MIKKFTIAIFAFVLVLLALASCSNDNDSPSIQPPPSSEALTALPRIWDVPERPESETISDEFRVETLLQLTPLVPGELLVTMHTTMGDIVLRFFPTEAPQAVENFLTHAWDGYYNGVSFHRVIENFMMQGGCPDGTGMSGQSIWGHNFGQELSTELRHFRGALAMAQTQMPNSIGSQFYIVQATDVVPLYRSEFVNLLERQDEIMQEFADGSYVTIGDVFPEESLRYFLENGGTPGLDWHFSNNPHTVFGHVVRGMDVVDAIVRVPVEGGGETNQFQHRPVEPVLITGFTFRYYEGE